MIGRDEILAALAAHGRVAAAVVIETRGSAPRDAGALMLVHAGGTRGTIGGGAVEHRATQLAQQTLLTGGAPTTVGFPLNPSLDQCCGGHVTVAVGLIDPAQIAADATLWPGGPAMPPALDKRPVCVFGGGHVGQAIVQALEPLPFHVTLIDARPEIAPPDGIDTRITPLPEAEAGEASDDAFHLVLTHSHALDLEIVTAILSRPFGFCGLIGSATKRALFQRRLAERGIATEAIGRLTCPIGLPGIHDKRPAVIAASVAAQLLLRDGELRGTQ